MPEIFGSPQDVMQALCWDCLPSSPLCWGAVGLREASGGHTLMGPPEGFREHLDTPAASIYEYISIYDMQPS